MEEFFARKGDGCESCEENLPVALWVIEDEDEGRLGLRRTPMWLCEECVADRGLVGEPENE